MKLSIIIPTYNRGSIIRSTLDSIKAQTYKEWECVVVDDQSTDNTHEVIEEYMAEEVCPECGGTRLSEAARAPRLMGISVTKFFSTRTVYPLSSFLYMI